MTARARARNRVPWHRRLSLRLALLLAATLLAFDFLGGPLLDRLLTAVGVPPVAETVYLLSETQWETKAATGLAAALALDDAAGDPSRPDPGAVRVLSTALIGLEEAFALLDDRDRIVATGGELPWKTGDRWPFARESHRRVDIPGDPPRPAHVVYVPARPDSPGAGTLAYLILIEDAPDEPYCAVEAASRPGDELRVFADEAAFELSLTRESRIGQVISVGFAVITALLLAFVVSRLVTRRLSRLSAAASTAVGPGGALPGPFDERGGDEVAVLAETMNSMRARVGELVDGLARQDGRRREWVAQVSHDLRTPLTALMACLDRAELVLERRDGAATGKELREIVAVLRMDADRVQALADDLLEMGRLESRDALSLEPVPPGELARQAARGIEPLARQEGIAIDVSVQPGLPVLTADGGRLMRALENLLRNAIQHASCRVEIAITGGDGRVRFEVRDDGPGLPGPGGRVELSSLRDHRSRDDSAGLGLVVTQRVAEAHRGRSGARDLPGGGAAVWFDLPVEPARDE